MVLKDLFLQMGFWVSWMLIPIIYELFPAINGFFTLIKASKRIQEKKRKVRKLPRISLIIPAYNSEETLFDCIKSVNDCSYPNGLITIIVANNGSLDDTFSEYKRARLKFNTLFLQWINTDKGKANALNSAIYRSRGKYVINIDSDGILHRKALINIVRAFENDNSLDAQTGTILTQPSDITSTKSRLLRILQENEYFEYAQSFLAGRAIESAKDHLFTMSGAFSAFRRDKLLKTRLYNVKTVGEDIDMTFQISYQLQGRVALCPEAIFYVTPIESIDKLYVQRQRWQRGELEASHYFMNEDNLKLHHVCHNYIIRRLIMDHTILLLRMIWMVSIFALIPLGYSISLILWSFLILYFLYVFICILNFISIQFYLRYFPDDRKFYLSKSYILITLPMYYFVCSIFDVIGIINSMTEPSIWKVQSFTQETTKIKKIVCKDLRRLWHANEK